MSDLVDQYEALTDGFGAVWLQRDVIEASGPDVVSYLQGQLSQDIEQVAVGTSTWAWLLQPHGKVDALVRLTRGDDSIFLIDCDAGHADHILERLNRFKLRTKVDFTTTKFKVLGLRGARAERPSVGVVAELHWPGLSGFDVIGEDIEVPDDATLCTAEAYEAVRIEAGVPKMGAELDQLTIPAEAGINDRSISFTKGCYTGQELVARIDARGGNVPRNLRVVVIDAHDMPTTHAFKVTASKATSSTKPFGTITSLAFSPRREKMVGLAFIRRDVLAPASAVVLWDDGPSPCQIEKPPLQSS